MATGSFTFNNFMRATLFCFSGLAFVWAVSLPLMAQQEPSVRRTAETPAPLHLADYDSELRRPDGRVDIEAMVRRLKELGVTTYYWLVWHAATDWDDLKLFREFREAAQLGEVKKP